MKLGFTGGNKKDYDFTNFSPLIDLFRAIYYGEILIPAAEREQYDFDNMFELLKNYEPRKDKGDLLIKAQNFYDGRKMITEAFKNKFFPLASGNYYEESKEESSKSEDTEESLESEDREEPKEGLKQRTDKLDTYYGSDLINKSFKSKSLKEIINQLKNY